jgi:hypothetical protein
MHVPERPPVPEARVVRQAGVLAPREPLHEQVAAILVPVARHLGLAVGYMVALWPLTASVMLIAALLWAVGVAGGP